MRCAIYSAGPSIARTWRGGYGLGIAINGASLIVPPEQWQWLCCGDHDAFSDAWGYPAGMGSFCQFLDFIGWADPIAERHKATRWIFPKTIPYWKAGGLFKYTLAGSLLLAEHLGATSVDLYGHDMAIDEQNVERRGPAFTYTENRASLETIELAQAVGMLARHGIPFTRISP